ncbi:uncharacterized protein LOC141708424 isoform X1 [Apium graveolens]|uniref:uncharacterized protein LOC141708424 isoform X1 n=1 Tax=Apium graveolens TaxID=4045 RepID=UPI003D7AB416
MVDGTFKETFLLFVLGCFLCPCSKDIPCHDLYSALSIVSNAQNYNWAKFVFDYLIKAIKEYKERKEESVEIEGANPGIGGCIHFLKIVFLQRVHPLTVDGDKPLISAWTNDRIKNAMKEDKILALKAEMKLVPLEKKRWGSVYARKKMKKDKQEPVLVDEMVREAIPRIKTMATSKVMPAEKALFLEENF